MEPQARDDAARFLPSEVERQLASLAGRVAGVCLIAVLAFFWLAVITWSADDPSFSNATAGPTRNFAGPVGAILSDLALQAIGFGVLFVLLVASVFAGELLRAGRIAKAKRRAIMGAIAATLLTAGAAGIPVAAGWPLASGYGGVLGDLLLNTATAILSLFRLSISPFVHGLVAAIGGLILLVQTIGLTLADLRRLAHFEPRPVRSTPPKPQTQSPAVAPTATPAANPRAEPGPILPMPSVSMPPVSMPAFSMPAATMPAARVSAQIMPTRAPSPAVVMAPTPGHAQPRGHGHGPAQDFGQGHEPGYLHVHRQAPLPTRPQPTPHSAPQTMRGSTPQPAPWWPSERITAPKPPVHVAVPPAAAQQRARNAAPLPAPMSAPSTATVPVPLAAPAAAPVAQPPAPDRHLDDEDGTEPFDLTTDIESVQIASRFAPSQARPPMPIAAQPLPAPQPPLPIPQPLPPMQLASAPVASRQAPAASPLAVPPQAASPLPQAGAPQPVHQLRETVSRAFFTPAPPVGENAFALPSLTLLTAAPARRPQSDAVKQLLRDRAKRLEQVLADFGIKGQIKDIRPGPVVTVYEVEPAPGVKSARVIGLAWDIARSMAAETVRIAVIPGRNAIGIELPNPARETVHLREILESAGFKREAAAIPLALGRDITGEPMIADLAAMPHLLVAGTTGSGKSVGINAMILSLLYRFTPSECRLLLIDPKMLELSAYNGIPHLLTPVIVDPGEATTALAWAVREMEERYKRLAELGVRSLETYNNRVRNARKAGEALARRVQTGFDPRSGQPIFEETKLNAETMPLIVIVIDELADLMAGSGKEIEVSLQRLAQKARAAGMHIIMATQRPSVDVVTGVIKANFPCRISFKVATRVDSRTILDEQGAEELLGQGDMLLARGGAGPERVHGAYVGEGEVEAVARHLREQGPPRYIASIKEGDGAAAGGSGPTPEQVYDTAVSIVLADQKASASYLQRKLGISPARSAELMERMEKAGLVGPAAANGKRQVLVGRASRPRAGAA